jgi:hypothetical protein
MQRHEVDIRIVLHECLCPIAVVDVPVHNENTLRAERFACVVRSNGNIPKEAKPHRAIVHGMMPRWTDSAEATWVGALQCKLYSIEHTPNCSGCSVP